VIRDSIVLDVLDQLLDSPCHPVQCCHGGALDTFGGVISEDLYPASHIAFLLI